MKLSDIYYEIVKKIVGPINPVGETNEDDRRFENLMVMTSLVDKLLTDIDTVGMEKTREEYSRKRAGEFADKFLTRMGIEE
jgi:hypothetical protein